HAYTHVRPKQLTRHTHHLFFFHAHATPRYLHSFPTRRSSDLIALPDHSHAAAGLYHGGHHRLGRRRRVPQARTVVAAELQGTRLDRKSTRLNSSHVSISYAVFCLKKKTLTRQQSCSSAHTSEL